jgi:hypothetical protein
MGNWYVYVVGLIATAIVIVLIGSSVGTIFINPGQLAIGTVIGTGIAGVLVQFNGLGSTVRIGAKAIATGVLIGIVYFALVLLGPYDSAALVAGEPTPSDLRTGVVILCVSYLVIFVVVDRLFGSAD